MAIRAHRAIKVETLTWKAEAEVWGGGPLVPSGSDRSACIMSCVYPGVKYHRIRERFGFETPAAGPHSNLKWQRDPIDSPYGVCFRSGGAQACRGKSKGVSSDLDYGLIIDPPRCSHAPGISLLTQNIELRLVATAMGPSIQAVPRANEVKLENKQYSATYQLITAIAMCIKIK